MNMSFVTPLYTFYGDDFTGSTDVLEQLAGNGVPAVLFLAPPTEKQLQCFPGMRAFGIAGDSRSRSPEWMSENLPRIFATLQSFAAPIVHYKVCSTFDSSPTHGNIGRAMELGLAAFGSRFVPIVVGAPHLRRFVLDGKLFASAPDGDVHRIDRHPMSRHPVTPMLEPDLRRHLAAQTDLPMGLISHDALHAVQAASQALETELAAGNLAVLFDTIDESCLRTIGSLLWAEAQRRALFSASSSGLTNALLAAWKEADFLPSSRPENHFQRATPLLVMSGSCSVATERQIGWAVDHGFVGIPVDPERLLQEQESASYRQALIQKVFSSLDRGEDVVLYSALGGVPSSPVGEALGVALGSILRDLITQKQISRVVLCGGDTSSHAVQQLDLFALTWVASLQPGAPLCRTHSSNSGAAPLELVLKGGQVGSEDFFAIARGL